jgi:drug/metabolite transporter (DMT)-like permease
MFFAILAGVAWGAGGYFEKEGLKLMALPPLSGNGSAWLMLVLGGGLVAGSLGMWSFYKALSLSENLGVTLALAFACSPLAGTLLGLVRRDHPMTKGTAVGLLTIVAGIVVLQLSKVHPKH